ncbi:MAG: M56 family metallopeptidase, partial [Bacteroidetes bacterium]|nr:M56 family metallopeptidase [Bacteroidota bacterium]
MHIPALQQDAFVRALGWTLVHALWQGLLLAILAGMVVLLTRQARAGLRYNLLVWLVALFVCGSCITFAVEWRQQNINTLPAGTIVTTQNIGQPVNNLLLPVFHEPAPETPRRFSEIFIDYLNTHAPLIVLIWFLLFSFKLVRLMADLSYVQRIRHRKTYAPPLYWKEKLQSLAEGLHIRQHVRLLQSELVQVPLVIGVLKPIVLVPLGILTQLPAEQVEAILLHELAHIRRRDYLVNLLQSIAETIFFFNPAIWWVSSLIREERENCCDDIAIAGIKSKTAFLDALVSFQEYRQEQLSVACGLAFPGKKNHLLNRAKRILHEQNKTLNTMEKSLLSFCIAVIALLLFVGNRPVIAQETPARASKKRTAPVVSKDTSRLPAGEEWNETPTVPPPPRPAKAVTKIDIADAPP